jgi:biotin-(acetyl-CoA carboxylase) ligase
LQLLANEPEQLGRRANEYCMQHGSRLTLQAGARRVSGVCAGIAPDGALVLDTFGGRQTFYSGVLVK